MSAGEKRAGFDSSALHGDCCNQVLHKIAVRGGCGGWYSLTFSATYKLVPMGGDLCKVGLFEWTAIGSRWEKLSRNNFLEGLLWFSSSGKESKPAAQSSTQGPPPSGALCLLASCSPSFAHAGLPASFKKKMPDQVISLPAVTLVSCPLTRVLVLL